MQTDRGLARPRAALDHERPVGGVRDQAVLVGLDRGDDVAHPRLAAAVELLEQEVSDARAVEGRAVERLVGDVRQPSAGGAEAPAERDALRVDRRGGVEGSGRGRLPVDDELPLLGVLHPATTDVERPLDIVEVEAAKEEPALGVLVGDEPLRAPGLERQRGDVLVGRVRRPCDHVAHLVEGGVGTVDVRLLGGQIRVTHVPERTEAGLTRTDAAPKPPARRRARGRAW